ncbi:MAG: methyltransferase domain-containing protein [Acidobacteriota bacterium]
MTRNSDQDDYLLGHGEREWDRLAEQHQLWRSTLLGTLDRLGLARPGSSVLEVGCGNGALLADLAERVGANGRAAGVEKDPAAVERARAQAEPLPWTTIDEGDIFDLGATLADDETFDLVVARWVLSFLDRPQDAVAQLAARVRPGGHLLIQDYIYDLIRMVPDVPALGHLFYDVMPGAYEQSGGDAWIGLRIPGFYSALGLDVVEVVPHAKAGGPDSPVFRWARRFFTEHLQSLIDTGLLNEAEGRASLNGWEDAAATGATFYSPVVVDVVGRRPE